MPRKQKQHDRQFKLDALQYVWEHPDLTQEECCQHSNVKMLLKRISEEFMTVPGRTTEPPRLLPSSVKKEPVLASERLASTCVKWESEPNG